MINFPNPRKASYVLLPRDRDVLECILVWKEAHDGNSPTMQQIGDDLIPPISNQRVWRIVYRLSVYGLLKWNSDTGDIELLGKARGRYIRGNID